MLPVDQTLYIDADACPVKAEAEQIATRHQIQMVLVTNGGIRPSQNPLVSLMIVEMTPDSADMAICARVNQGDIVVTSDILLAANVLKKGGQALRPNGDIFTADNIGLQLAKRDLMADRRAADPFFLQSQKGGQKSFSARDRSQFRNSLELLMTR